MRWLIAAIVFGGLGLIGVPIRIFADGTGALADDAEPTDDPSRKFFEQYCHSCYTGAKPKGDFRVDTLAQDFADKENRARWLNVVEQLKSETMPPKGKPRPAANEMQALIDWIDGQVAGGGFQHGQHLAFDPQNPPPLCNLYVSMLQRLGIEVDKFSTGTGPLTGLEFKRS